MKTPQLMAELALLEKVYEALDVLRGAGVLNRNEVRGAVKRFMDARPKFKNIMQTAIKGQPK